uniref:Cytochrome c oxidase subunit 2 n=1 Tax=Imasa heleensis TaxID=2772037 RepID=A0A893DD34_9EUKA|nr:cytochrome c oxidase subunit 2 [Imasa heleensis]QRR29764.1 cytochrome c oxidase subunit 2 [Imasa heleensis]
MYKMLNFLFNQVHCDSAITNQLSFQDPATPVMEGIIDLHHDIFFFLIIILCLVSWVMTRICISYNSSSNPKPHTFKHHTMLEIVWTILPALVLVTIVGPSFTLLYAMDEVIDPAITIKAVGHQWYWSYEYCDYDLEGNNVLNFDSYIVPEEDLEIGQLRLLEVDNRVVLPINTHIRVITTSTDVIHSWAVPSLGTKTDAVPGRLNQMSLYIRREGVYYGQCSEICGVNHGFMPIVVEAVSLDDYIDWISTKLSE